MRRLYDVSDVRLLRQAATRAPACHLEKKRKNLQVRGVWLQAKTQWAMDNAAFYQQMSARHEHAVVCHHGIDLGHYLDCHFDAIWPRAGGCVGVLPVFAGSRRAVAGVAGDRQIAASGRA